MSMERSIDLNYDFSAAYDGICYACERDAVIEKISFVFFKAAVKDAVNFTKIEIIDKGIDGTGTTVVASLTNETGAVGAIDFPVNQIVELEPYYSIGRGHVMTLTKTETAGGSDLGAACFMILSERRK